jgi:hypothetical protein
MQIDKNQHNNYQLLFFFKSAEKRAQHFHQLQMFLEALTKESISDCETENEDEPIVTIEADQEFSCFELGEWKITEEEMEKLKNDSGFGSHISNNHSHTFYFHD